MNRIKRHRYALWIAVFAAALSAVAQGGGPARVSAAASRPDPTPPSGCHFQSARGDIQHVSYLQFDIVHFSRDIPNVPSDLEQMPRLVNLLTSNGVLLSNHHTLLISHTAGGI